MLHVFYLSVGNKSKTASSMHTYPYSANVLRIANRLLTLINMEM